MPPRTVCRKTSLIGVIEMRSKKIRAVIVVAGWLVGIVALMCAGGAVDGSGSIQQVMWLGLIGLVCIGVAVVAQRIGGR